MDWSALGHPHCPAGKVLHYPAHLACATNNARQQHAPRAPEAKRGVLRFLRRAGFWQLSMSLGRVGADVTASLLARHTKTLFSTKLTRIVPWLFQGPIAGASLHRSRVQSPQALLPTAQRRGPKLCNHRLNRAEVLPTICRMSGAVFVPTPAGFTGQIEPADAHARIVASAADATGALLHTPYQHDRSDVYSYIWRIVDVAEQCPGASCSNAAWRMRACCLISFHHGQVLVRPQRQCANIQK